MGRLEEEISLIPFIVEEIHKRAMKGDNPIYLKSAHILEDNHESIKIEMPELIKKGGIYNKQLISHNLSKFGFSRKPSNHHNSVFKLEW